MSQTNSDLLAEQNKKRNAYSEKFVLNAPFSPTGDQPQAISTILKNIASQVPEQVLLGVTGSGKTFTMAKIIESLQRPTLIISHNKTLAAQLYQEFKEFFPNNAVSYFVSYYDYYQPEAYVPQSNTYIEKETEINEEIDKLRLAATMNLLTRRDTIIVASVSCIYNIGSPREYGHFALELQRGVPIGRNVVMDRLVQLQYDRNDFGFTRGTFRVRGDSLDIFPAYEDTAIHLTLGANEIISLERIDPLTGKVMESVAGTVIYPAKHYMTDRERYKSVFSLIQQDLAAQVAKFSKEGKLIEAQRIQERVNHDLEMIQEMGYVNGIENYSRYFDGREAGSAPYTLFDYYDEALGHDRNKWLLFIDESHMTVPQIRGMYNGDRSRKQTLVDYGFRLPSALDNRPMRFEEFLRAMPQTVYVSATPDAWEIERSGSDHVVEQLIRPTGLLDPTVTIRPLTGQIQDLLAEIEKRVKLHERTLVTTLTKAMAEDLTAYLKEKNILVSYVHSDVQTIERTDILRNLRLGTFDVIVGVNLLREGLDLPEVSLVAILDADKEGFLRSRTSLIQTMGRAARHIHGEVILYADKITPSIKVAVEEVGRRRIFQDTYNNEHNITPLTIEKNIRGSLVSGYDAEKKDSAEISVDELVNTDTESMTPQDVENHIKKLTTQMKKASRELNFEYATILRDAINKLKSAV